MRLSVTHHARVPVCYDGALTQKMMGSTHPTRAEVTYSNLYSDLMKIIFNIKDSLLTYTKAFATKQRTSLNRLIEEILRHRLRSPRADVYSGKRKLPVLNGRSGLVAGVNPSSNKSMLDAADDHARCQY
jgi:hypothetical protein